VQRESKRPVHAALVCATGRHYWDEISPSPWLDFAGRVRTRLQRALAGRVRTDGLERLKMKNSLNRIRTPQRNRNDLDDFSVNKTWKKPLPILCFSMV
jgi:hypothetical protein